jgi:hypothetical protein
MLMPPEAGTGDAVLVHQCHALRDRVRQADVTTSRVMVSATGVSLDALPCRDDLAGVVALRYDADQLRAVEDDEKADLFARHPSQSFEDRHVRRDRLRTGCLGGKRQREVVRTPSRV